MAVISVQLTHSGREGGVNERDERRYRQQYLAITDDPHDGVPTVGGDPRIPKLFMFYSTPNETDFDAGCISVEPRQRPDSRYVWDVEVLYSTVFDVRDEDPLRRLPDVFWGSIKSTEVVWRDRNGKGIVNSAGDYFDPPLERPVSRRRLMIVRNEAHHDPQLGVDFEDAVNQKTFLGFPPNTVKVEDISARTVREGRRRYDEAGYEFHVKKDGWTLRPLDQGRREGQRKTIRETDEDGNFAPVGDPVPLDGAGKVLLNPSPATVKFGAFDVFPEKDFDVLGFAPPQLFFVPAPFVQGGLILPPPIQL